MKSPFVGEIIGFRQVHDGPPEVLVRVQRPMLMRLPYFGMDPCSPVETLAGYEWGSEWREATEFDMLLMGNNTLKL